MIIWGIGALFTMGFILDAKPRPSFWKLLIVAAIWPITLGIMLRNTLEQGIELWAKVESGKFEEGNK